MTALSSLLRDELVLYLLECTRITGIVLGAPLIWVRAPARIRVVLVLLLALSAHGISGSDRAPPGLFEAAWAFVTELGVGLAMGLTVRFAIAAAEVCGDVVSPLLGLGVAHVFDATAQSSSGLLTQVLRHLAILLAVVAGIHRVLIGGVLASFRVLPPGTAASSGQAFPTILQMSAGVFQVGVRVAIPLLAILFMTQVSLAFVARAAPQLQIFSIGFAVTLTVGLSVMIMVIPDIGQGVIAELTHVEARCEAILMELGASP